MKHFFKPKKSVEMLEPSETGPKKVIDLVLANFHSHFSSITFFGVGSNTNRIICMLKQETAFTAPVLVCHYLIQTIFHSMPLTLCAK